MSSVIVSIFIFLFAFSIPLVALNTLINPTSKTSIFWSKLITKLTSRLQVKKIISQATALNPPAVLSDKTCTNKTIIQNKVSHEQLYHDWCLIGLLLDNELYDSLAIKLQRICFIKLFLALDNRDSFHQGMQESLKTFLNNQYLPIHRQYQDLEPKNLLQEFSVKRIRKSVACERALREILWKLSAEIDRITHLQKLNGYHQSSFWDGLREKQRKLAYELFALACQVKTKGYYLLSQHDSITIQEKNFVVEKMLKVRIGEVLTSYLKSIHAPNQDETYRIATEALNALLTHIQMLSDEHYKNAGKHAEQELLTTKKYIKSRLK